MANFCKVSDPVFAGSGAGTAADPMVPVVLTATTGWSVAPTITRPADTNAYSANDVVGAAAATIAFSAIGPATGGEVLITSAALQINSTSVPNGMSSYRLYLYSAPPPSALADNAPWDLPAGDRAAFLGYLDLGVPVDLGSTLYVETNGLAKQLRLAGTTLYGYLVTNGGYTPEASSAIVLTLHSIGV